MEGLVLDSSQFNWGIGLVIVFGLLALAFALYKGTWVNRQDPGTKRMREIDD